MLFRNIDATHFVSYRVIMLAERRGVPFSAGMACLGLVHGQITTDTANSSRTRTIGVSRIVGEIAAQNGGLFDRRASMGTHLMII